MSLVLWPGIDVTPIAVQVMHAQSIRDKGVVRKLTGMGCDSVTRSHGDDAGRRPHGASLSPVSMAEVRRQFASVWASLACVLVSVLCSRDGGAGNGQRQTINLIFSRMGRSRLG